MIGPSPASVSAAEAAQAAADGKVIVYFRRMCVYCEKLRIALGSARKDVVWVDIWADPEAAAYVRSVNDGNETVPTVVIDGVPHTNPPTRLVKAALAG